MLQFLQRNSSINYILLPIVVLLLWGTNLIEPKFVLHFYDETPMILYKPLMALQNSNALLGQLVALAILAVNVISLVKINSTVRLIEKRSVFYVFLFLIFSASLQDFKQLNPMQPALFFIILGLSLLFRMYKQERELKIVFESAVCFSISSLFYAPSIYFVALVFLGLMIMVPFYWRQWLSAIIGVLLPIIMVFALSFCFDSLSSQIEIWKVNLLTPRTATFNYFFPLIFSFFLGFLFVLAMIFAFSGGLKKVVLRKYYFLLLLFLFIVLLVYFLMPNVGYEFLFFGLLPAAIFIANYMVNIRIKIFADVVLLLLIAMAVLVQLFPDKILNF